MRINKFLAEKKYSTRKGADELIKKGLVTINGRLAVIGEDVNEEDKIEVKNFTEEYAYYAYNKKRGVTTNKEVGAKSILETTKFPTPHRGGKNIFPVGRLDKDSRGLLIMTNDGRITDKLLNPKFDHEKEYEVTVDKNISDIFISKMGKGVKLPDGYVTKPSRVKKIGPKTFSIILTEGKNRQIRRMCDRLGYHVTDLLRIRIMNISLGKIKEGSYREISGTELETFLKSISL